MMLAHSASRKFRLCSVSRRNRQPKIDVFVNCKEEMMKRTARCLMLLLAIVVFVVTRLGLQLTRTVVIADLN